MNHRTPSGAGGFTLLEVLITLLLLAIGILGVGGLAITTVQGNARGNQLTTATILAQDKVEQARTAGYAGAGALAGTEGYGAVAGNPAYKRVVSVADATPGTWMKTVTVTVSWDGDAHGVTLSTIVAREFT
jgi:prepilin-type N-terminal cleavage/methylation domain-containing protein